MVSKSILVSAALAIILVAVNWYSVSSREGSRRVWMTLLTNEQYLDGALTLDFSLKKYNSKYPLVVFHPETVGKHVLDELSKRNIETKKVNLLLPTTHKDYGPDERFYDCWSKLLPHGMTEYDRIVELDADMLLRDNADELMEMKLPSGTMAASHACVCNPRKLSTYPKDWVPENCAYTAQHASPETAHLLDHAVSPNFGTAILNGGLQVIDPNRKHFNDILAIMSNASLTETFAFADQSLLSYYFKDHWISLPYIYNALKTLRTAHEPIWRDDKAKIIHYILGDKPWNDVLKEKSDFVPNTWWWQHNNERLHAEKMAKVKADTDSLISENKVIIFSKSYCPHCRAAKATLSGHGVSHKIVELDQVEDGALVQQYLVGRSGQRTVPHIFVKSKFVGGNSDLTKIREQPRGLEKLFS